MDRQIDLRQTNSCLLTIFLFRRKIHFTFFAIASKKFHSQLSRSLHTPVLIWDFPQKKDFPADERP